MLEIRSCCCALVLACILVVEAKIVFINGTEIADENLRTINLTTSAPFTKWFSVFDPRNISNHSGTKTKDSPNFNRKTDDKEQTITDDKNDNNSYGSMATRTERQLNLFNMQQFLNGTGRQVTLFTMQRFLSGMHMMALLAGIYLMIFVVEPVAIPNEYLAQHYFGLPWASELQGADSLHREPLENLQFVKRNGFLQEANTSRNKIQKNPIGLLNRPQSATLFHQTVTLQPKVQGRKPSPVYHHKSNSNHSSSNATSRVKYITAQELQRRRNSTSVGKVRHWSKWIPPQNSTNKGHPVKPNTSEWSPSLRITHKESIEGGKAKVFTSAGSASSVRLSEIRH